MTTETERRRRHEAQVAASAQFGASLTAEVAALERMLRAAFREPRGAANLEQCESLAARLEEARGRVLVHAEAHARIIERNPVTPQPTTTEKAA